MGETAKKNKKNCACPTLQKLNANAKVIKTDGKRSILNLYIKNNAIKITKAIENTL